MSQVLQEAVHVLAGILAGWSTLSLLMQWFDPFIFSPAAGGKWMKAEKNCGAVDDEEDEDDEEDADANSIDIVDDKVQIMEGDIRFRTSSRTDALQLLEHYGVFGASAG
eukprot:CAMPEP_0178421488 /NCGR_PEP_ID=MMETSP0689_2-20121128/26673_1 /TAXON_ID=160604 /ORGANISM="Amphidinium massartii, Strain CS-259" /LENGTH=108 /DNA_ID=CAMNT_0020043001 /DNA_START=210 /DNA_END=533 /DNA_ORIENTATION=+